MPKISVIIPTFNSGKYIKEAIESVLRQTYKDLEIIVCDDGSTDDTKKVLERYSEKIRYFFQKNNGPAAARNKGIEHAKGEFIAFLDADDEWLPEKLELQINEILKSDSVGLVTCGRYIIYENGNSIVFQPEINNLSKQSLLKTLVMKNVIGGGSSVLARKACFEKVGLFDEKLLVSEDIDMWFRICKDFDFISINKPLLKYRHLNGSQSYFAEKNLENQLFYLQKIFSDNEFHVSTFLKSKAVSERFFCAAWSFMNAKIKSRAKECILHSFLANPVYFVSERGMLGLFFRIMIGETTFNFFRRNN